MRTPSVYTGCTLIGFSPDDQLRGYASDGQHLWYWQVAEGSECRALAAQVGSSSYQSFACDFSPDGQWIAFGSSYGVHLWNRATGLLLNQAEIGGEQSALPRSSARNMTTFEFSAWAPEVLVIHNGK